ncbi:MAG: O-antigen ligase family protein, partial [bacterium]|nr:O-antigen ligase family protein [bacterium]
MQLKEYIKKYWLMFIIMTQPILDIIAYFTFNENITIISFCIRSIYLAFIIIYTFIKSNNKKKYLLCIMPFAIFAFLHLLNTYRSSGLDIFNDLRYIINVMQFPVVTICLIDYLKHNSNQIKQVEKGIVIAYIIIFISVIISIITNTYNMTYEDYGITGWFTSANTQSMILTILSPLCLYYCSKKNNYIYLLSVIMVFVLLFFNGTRACYYTLILSLPVICYILFINREKNVIKTIITVIAFISCIVFYGESFASDRQNIVDENTKNQEEVSEIKDKEKLSKQESIDILNNSAFYKQAIKDFDEDRVYEYMKDKITAYNLTDNRLLKKMYGKLSFDEGDILTKLLGINHKVIDDYGKDLENDFTAIFYYYGYLGFGLYILFILYFAYLGIKTMILKPIKVVSPKFIILTFTILLSLFGAEYSGALLRKTNANIYLSIVFAIYYIYLICSEKNENIKIQVNNNKMSFLLLHLGYGGIESSTINTANSLCDKYDIEIMSFYKLDKNQANKLNDKIKIKYLYDGGPNKEEFLNAMHKHKFIKALKEGI